MAITFENPTGSNKTLTTLNPNIKKNLTKISSTKEAVDHCMRPEILIPGKFKSIEELKSYFERSEEERIREWIPEIKKDFDSQLTFLHCDHLHSMLFVTTENFEFYHFELPTLELIKQIDLKEFGITSPIVAMAMPSDNSQCIGGTENGLLVSYNIETKEVKILESQVYLGRISFFLLA